MRHWDCHMHMVLDGTDWRAAIDRHRAQPDLSWIRRQLECYRAAGYTWLRDGGDRWGVGAAARELASEYGIVYRTPLAPLCLGGHYGAFIGEKYEDLTQYRELVKKTRKNGGDFIKIMISGLMDFHHCGLLTEPGLEEDLIRELIHIAHEEGFSVMAHCNGAHTARAAALAGVDSIEHGAYLDEDALQAMADRRVIWCPTVSTVANLPGKGRFPDEAVKGIYAGTRANLLRYEALGGLIAPGSDAGAWQVFHGGMTEYDHLEAFLQPQTLVAGARAVEARF